ncbi:MAG: phenylalanine 4-monooxygenase [Gammaproteobacteria bacterium]
MKKHVYIAKQPDQDGIIPYTEQENEVWHTLYNRQVPIVEPRACQAYLDGLEGLKLSPSHVPQCAEVSKALQKATGWSVVPVKALISFEEFFTLLASKRFPAASFIRIPEELDYLQEPDIFHEIFGHCPMLMHSDFAKFTETFGKIGLQAGPKERARLARLYWFTAEFGLFEGDANHKIYGAGILSSKSETIYAAEHPSPERAPFDLLTALRTPYRYDIIQTLYYTINDFKTLYRMVEEDLLGLLKQAKQMGDLKRSLEKPEIDDMRSC